MHPKLAQTTVSGDPNAVDSFAACLTAVASAIKNTKVNYWYVEALAGTSFSPCLNKGENCICWMVDGGNSYRYGFMGKALGLAITRHEMATPQPDKWVDDYKSNKAMPIQVQQYFGLMKSSLDKGDFVIVASWPAWSIITGWNDDVTNLPFATTPGFQDVVSQIWPPVNTRYFFTINNSPDVAHSNECIHDVIAFGSAIASGNVSSLFPDFEKDLLFGGVLYDEIIQVSENEGLYPNYTQKGCFSRMMKRINNGHNSSKEYLSFAAHEMPRSDLSELIRAASLKYADLEDISGKYLDWDIHKGNCNSPEFAVMVVDDFTAMKRLHKEASDIMCTISDIVTKKQKAY